MNLRPVGAEASFDLADLHDKAFDRPWTALEFEELLKSPGVFAVLGEAGEPTASKGFILCRSIAGEAEILTIAVNDKMARFGLGWRLMQAAMREARNRGGEAMFLEVDDGNAAALGLYRKLGFEKAGERPAYYTDESGRRTSALVMRRDLR